MQAEQYPGYFLFLDIDPSAIDINVHPTKTEIKFEDERLIYNYLKVCIKHGLGQYSLAPMLDFNSDSNFNHAEKYILQNQMGSDEYHHPSLASHSAISSGSHRSTLKKKR